MFRLTPPEEHTGRRELDAYYTPRALADALVGHIPVPVPARSLLPRILEPSVGTGSFLRAARARWGQVETWGLDLDPTAAGLAVADHARVGDFLADGSLDGWPEAFDVVIGNPPYAEAEAHVRRALACTRRLGVCAMLLRMGFLESIERFQFWQGHAPLCVYVLAQRPSFTGGGTDKGQCYGWFVWTPAKVVWPSALRVISWR